MNEEQVPPIPDSIEEQTRSLDGVIHSSQLLEEREYNPYAAYDIDELRPWGMAPANPNIRPILQGQGSIPQIEEAGNTMDYQLYTGTAGMRELDRAMRADTRPRGQRGPTIIFEEAGNWNPGDVSKAWLESDGMLTIDKGAAKWVPFEPEITVPKYNFFSSLTLTKE